MDIPQFDTKQQIAGTNMKMKKARYVAPWLAAAAVAAMVGAPAAMAADPESCTDIGTASECSSPGNVQINDSPPAVADQGFGGGFYGGPYPVPFDEGNR
jgi:hypothetical protein